MHAVNRSKDRWETLKEKKRILKEHFAGKPIVLSDDGKQLLLKELGEDDISNVKAIAQDNKALLSVVNAISDSIINKGYKYCTKWDSIHKYAVVISSKETYLIEFKMYKDSIKAKSVDWRKVYENHIDYYAYI